MDELAQKLAQGLINSRRNLYKVQYSVTQDQQNTAEVIVVIAVRTDQQLGEQIQKEVTGHIELKAIAGPKGRVCPTCRGTGRI